MVSFWFQGELVFHAPGDQASYQLFQTFFESLNHSRNENDTFYGNGRKYWHLYVSLLHTFGCSLCFLFLCLRRLLDDLQEKLHCSHKKGFSPVCLRLCIFRSEALEQEQRHCSQLKGFSHECVIICFLRLPTCVHWLQLKGFLAL